MKIKKSRKRNNDRITLGDIARYCNVSKATVSRVLNDKLHEFPVSDKMILKVKNAAQQLGYRPNRLAKAVRSQRTNLVGLSFIHINHHALSSDQIAYENQVMGQFTNIILSHPKFENYDLVIHDRREDSPVPLKSNDFKPDLLDGMIYLTPSENHTEFLNIAAPEFPIVLLGHTAEAEKKVPCIDINNHKAAQQAIDHLVGIKRKKIMMLIPEKLRHIQCIIDRINGYKTAIENHRLPVSPEFIRTVRCLPEAVRNFMQELRCIDEIDAVFCPSDELAALCIRALQEIGKRVPEDIAVIGFDNSSLAQHTIPPLTSVNRPVSRQAYEAIDLLLKILAKEIPYEPGFKEIETEIIIRESTVKN
ncbi:MAG: LacI family DNA-binding transcriptional regulator [Kiritimatiellales bacterium]